MARRRSSHSHAISGKSLRSSTFEGRTTHTGDALCGDGFAWPKEATSEAVAAVNRLATCPACSKKWGKAKLARAAGRVRLEPWTPSAEELATRGYREGFEPYRSAWRVYIDGVERAAVVNERGFGTPWEIRQLSRIERGRYQWHGRVIGGRPRHSYTAEPEGVAPIHRASRDAAAFACIALTEAGLLPTLEEQAEQEREAERRKAEREAEREAERQREAEERERAAQLKAERIETARLGLAELEARPDLSNLEAASLAAMRALLESMT